MTAGSVADEGFTYVDYVASQKPCGATGAVDSGAIDVTMQYISPSIMQVDAGRPIVVLAGIRPGSSSCSAPSGYIPFAF